MEEILFESCGEPNFVASPEFDASHMVAIPATMNKCYFEEIQNPSVVFTSCSLRGNVTSLNLQYADSNNVQCLGNFIIGVDGSYYQIKSLGMCRVGRTIYILSEGAVPSSAPTVNDRGYNLAKAYAHKTFYDDYDIGSATSCVGCGVIPNSGCYIGKSNQVKARDVDLIPIGVKYQGNIVLKCDHYYPDTGVVSPTACATGPIICRASNPTKLYSKGYPVTTCSQLGNDTGFMYVPICYKCFHCNPLIGWNCGAPAGFTYESASYLNGLNLSHYSEAGRRPTICSHEVTARIVYPDFMDAYKTCEFTSCYYNGNEKHILCPAIGDIVPQCCCNCYSTTYAFPWNGSYLYVCANRATCSPYSEASYSCSWNHNYVRKFYCENTSDAGASVYAALSQIPVPLVYINVPISYRVGITGIQSCIESGVIPIGSSDNNNLWSIRLPIVYINRRDMYYTDDPADYWANVCSGQTWPYYCFQGFNYETESTCLYCFAWELECCSRTCWYQNIDCAYISERFLTSELWSLVRTLMSKYNLEIFEGVSEHITYQPYAMLSRKACCCNFVNQEYMCCCNRYNLIQSISSEIPAFGYNCGLGLQAPEESAACIKDFIANECYACLYCATDCLLKHTCMNPYGLTLNNSLLSCNCNYQYSCFKDSKFFEDMICSNTAYIASAVYNNQCSCVLMLPYCTIKNIEAQSGLDFNYTVHTPTTSILVGTEAGYDLHDTPLRQSCYWGATPTALGSDTVLDITDKSNVYWPGRGCYTSDYCYGFSIVQNPSICTRYVVPALVCGRGVRKEFSWG